MWIAYNHKLHGSGYYYNFLNKNGTARGYNLNNFQYESLYEALVSELGTYADVIELNNMVLEYVD